MKLSEFFNTLDIFYNIGIMNTGISCRYYLQNTSFMYELFIDDKSLITINSNLFESDIIYKWNTNKKRLKIINDIRKNTMLIVNKKIP